MRVCMVTPHLPPEQSANALLPATLGDALDSHGVTSTYVSHPPHGPAPLDTGRRTSYVPRRGRGRFSRSRLGALVAGSRMMWGARAPVQHSDLVHLHSNGFLVEVGQWLARKCRKPYVVTLYGTDISAHEPSRHARYGAVVRTAACRVFYSRGLLDQAQRLGLATDPSVVIHAPVSAAFRPADDTDRAALRRDLGVGEEPILLTVKRLHPVAGHETLLAALPAVLRRCPTAMLWLAGDGELRPALEARSRELGIERHVRFLGSLDNEMLRKYYTAADLFVLPSQVESWGTVMLESLACGTSVVTTDTVGGIEVSESFPDAVTVVPKGQGDRLAEMISERLLQKRRASRATIERVQQRFSVEACARQYLAVYRRALDTRR
jgi:teichuronic acid biosynthesis glycosyltransferase TuaC